jgi:hypothetical protein
VHKYSALFFSHCMSLGRPRVGACYTTIVCYPTQSPQRPQPHMAPGPTSKFVSQVYNNNPFRKGLSALLTAKMPPAIARGGPPGGKSFTGKKGMSIVAGKTVAGKRHKLVEIASCDQEPKRTNDMQEGSHRHYSRHWYVFFGFLCFVFYLYEFLF